MVINKYWKSQLKPWIWQLSSNFKINIFTKYTKASFVTDAFHRTGHPYPRPKTPPGDSSGPPTEEEVQVGKLHFLSLFPVIAWPRKLMVEIRNTLLLKKKCRSVKVLSLVRFVPLLVVSLLAMALSFPEHAFAFPHVICVPIVEHHPFWLNYILDLVTHCSTIN